jgi:purine-cytosine permease-like protein
VNAARPAGNSGAGSYVSSMAEPRAKLGPVGKIAFVAVPLLIMLAVAGWYASRAWTALSGPPMPATGYIAMTLGIVFSLVVGCGLMGLLFYSNRYGYDEPHRVDDDHAE